MNRILTLPRIGFAVLLISGLIFGCKKLDTASNAGTNARKDFFTTPANAPSVIKRTIAEFERQNKITGFVKDLVAQNGMPLWEKSIINVSERKNPPTAGFDGDGSFEIGDTLVFTPLVEQDSLFVNGFFMSKVTEDSVELHLYRGNDYDNYAHGRLTSDSLTAEKITIQLMKLNTAVFGYKEFITTDSVLFKDDSPINPDSSYAFTAVKLKEDPGSGFAPSTTQNLLLTAVTVCRYYYSARIGRRGNDNSESSFMPWGGGSECTTTILVGYEWPPEYPIPTDNGGGGGMGSPPANGNCTGTTNCRQGSIISEGRFPCGNCGPGPIIVVPPDDPPIYTQYQLDLQWMLENMKDSTGNPCITSTLNTLKILDTTVPRLIREFFGVNPSFQMVFKTEYNSNWVASGSNYISPLGGQTIYNTSSDTFEVRINTYYQKITDLGLAATILHEAFHCQLLYWFRHAAVLNDTAVQNQLARDYGYVFKRELGNLDSNLFNIIISQPVSAQHQTMAVKFNNMVAQALQNFGSKKGISAPFSFYQKLAWTGLLDSKAFDDLSNSQKESIKDVIFAEKDPFSTILNPIGAPLNYNEINKKGHPCP